MSTFAIVVLVIIVVLLALGAAGFLARRRQMESTHDLFRSGVDQANRDLAAAHASDNGWEPSVVEAAARSAFTAQRPDVTIDDLALVQVIDPPGTDDDRAVWRVRAGGADHSLTLGRSSGEWVFHSLD